MLRTLRYVALPLGLIIAVWFIWRNDPGALLSRATGLGWLWVPALSASFLWNLVFTIGWRELIPRGTAGRPGLGRLYLIRQGGETLNFITPLGTVGGEPVKVMLLDVSPATGSASVVAARTFHAVAQISFGVTCLLVLLGLRSPEGRSWPLFVVAAVIAVGLFLFMLIQGTGVLERVAGWVSTRRPKLAEGLSDTSRELQNLYRSPAQVFRALLFFGAGWVATSLEPMVVFYAAGLEDFAVNAILITGLISLLSTAAVLVPASLGVMEGGLVGAFGLLGLDPVLALTVVVVRRIRELMWVGVGMACLAVLRQIPGASSTEATSA